MAALLVTESGLRNLGRLLRASRERAGWSMEDLTFEVRSRTGLKVSKATLSNLERGINKPDWNTLALLVAVGYVRVSADAPLLSVYEVFAVACEDEAFFGFGGEV